jgi:adenine-specific DNA-methyltransferase
MAKLTAKYKLNEEQIKQLKQIVPEAFKDNELDFNSLYEALSDFIDDDEVDIEQFGLSWPGKRAAKRAAAIPPVGTLVPIPGDGVDEETTRNIYIEGDNLEVLKIIKKAYTGRIKMIYIDPPYNTGNDFIYDDNFTESVESFQKRTGQIDESGVRMTTNNRSDGRFHSKWCSMIYPRLRLARELLRENGVVFISIDDNEVAQLRKICDEIFGEENFVDILIWKKMYGGKNDSKWFLHYHDYIIVYAKNKDMWFPNLLSRTDKQNDRYKNPDNDPRGDWTSADFTAIGVTASCIYEIIAPNGKKIMPPEGKRWISNYETYAKLLNDNRLWFGADGGNVPRVKRFLSEVKDGVGQSTFLDFSEVGHSDEANKELSNLLQGAIFDYPKPTRLLKRIIHLATNKDNNDIILDFFSGSATTAHAVMQLNAEDSGNRQFIMIQLPEICKEDSEAAKADFKNICEIGKERIRRAGKKIKKEAGLNAANLDIGFKVFRLAPSNYKAWENYMGTDIKQLEGLFKEDSLRQGWKEEDLLTEVMLLEGFPLNSKIEPLPQFIKNKVRKISSDFHENTLYICLDKNIHKETVDTLNLTDKDRFVCLDSAVDDQSKIRLEDNNLIKTL